MSNQKEMCHKAQKNIPQVWRHFCHLQTSSLPFTKQDWNEMFVQYPGRYDMLKPHVAKMPDTKDQQEITAWCKEYLKC
jgi:hypothetical protein